MTNSGVGVAAKKAVLKNTRWSRSGHVAFFCFVWIGIWVFAGLAPLTARAAGNCVAGGTTACVEDPAINACNDCHSIQVHGGNRNGTDRFITITSVGSSRHILDPMQADWTATVQAMVLKGAPATVSVAAGYLNMNYCTTCTGVILSNPAAMNITSNSATITWTTSLNGWGDGPADSVVFYGTSPTALTSQASDPTMTGSHAVNLTGLQPLTKYYFQVQSTDATGHILKYNFNTLAFRTNPPPSGGGGTTTTIFAYITNPDSNSISVVNVNTKTLQTTISLNETPFGIVASPDGKTVYASAWHPDPAHATNVNDVLVIDTATNTIKAVIANINPTSNNAPTGIAISPDGQYLFGAASTGNLVTISTTSLSVIKNTPVNTSGCCVNRIAVTPDGKTLYLIGEFFSGVPVLKTDVASAINPTAPQVFTSISLPATWDSASALTIGSDGRVWIAGGSGSGFFMINTNNISQQISGAAGGWGVALTPAGDFVFSSSIPNNGLQQLDTTKLTYTFAYPDSLNNYVFSGVAVTPDAATVLLAGTCQIAAACPDLLYFIDTFTLAVNTSVPIGLHSASTLHDLTLATITTSSGPPPPPPTFIYSANGSVNGIGNSASVIDPATNTVTTTIPVGFNPVAVAPSSDAKFVYVVNSDQTISVISRSTQTVTATITLPDSTSGLMSAIVNPGNTLLYVANHDANKIYVINTTTSAITGTIPVGSGPAGPLDLAISPDGTALYATVDVGGNTAPNADGYVAVIQTSNNRLVGQITLPVLNSFGYHSGGQHIAMNPLGGFAYVTASPYLIFLNTTTNSVITMSKPALPPGSTGCPPMPVAVTPDGSTIAVACFNVVSTYDTTTLQSTLHSGTNILNDAIGSIAFNADGSTAYLTDPVGTNVYAVNMTTMALTTTIAIPAASNMAASSPSVHSIPGGTPITLAAPDLTVTSLSATSPVNLSTLNNITITDTVSNIGGTGAGSFVISYYFSPTNFFNSATAVLIGSRSITGLNAGATNTASTTFTVSPTTIAAGNYYVIAFADATQLIAESNKDNNMTPTAGTVQLIVVDLVETAVSSPAIGTTVNAGATITVTDTVTNQGTATAGTFSVGYYLVSIPPYSSSQTLVGGRSVSSLAPGASSTGTVSVKIPTTAYGGTFYLKAVADPSNTIPEGNKTNNSYTNTSGMITLPLPDLVITAVTETPSSVTRPGSIYVTFTVTNQGLGASPSFSVGIYLSVDNAIDTADILLGWWSPKSGGLAAGASVTSPTLTFSINTSVPAGTYYVGAYADPLNTVQETNKTNNGLAASGTLVVK